MKLVEMSWPEIAAAAKNESMIALLPVASIEQHGPHLAVSTDTAIAAAIGSRAEEKLTNEIVLCPTLAFGSSHHHLGFAGALSLSPETFTIVLTELVESLLGSGFRRIVLLNSHGGNITPAQQALNVLSHRHDDALHPNIALAVYWDMAASTFRGEAPMESSAISHADEYETSMMLYLHPKRVHMERAQASHFAPSNAYLNWQNEAPSRGISMSRKFHLLLSNGSNGKPQLATAAKGEHLIERATQAVVEFLDDFKSWPFLTDLRNKQS